MAGRPVVNVRCADLDLQSAAVLDNSAPATGISMTAHITPLSMMSSTHTYVKFISETKSPETLVDVFFSLPLFDSVV